MRRHSARQRALVHRLLNVGAGGEGREDVVSFSRQTVSGIPHGISCLSRLQSRRRADLPPGLRFRGGDCDCAWDSIRQRGKPWETSRRNRNSAARNRRPRTARRMPHRQDPSRTARATPHWLRRRGKNSHADSLMKTISNKTQRPLSVPLPRGKILHLGPGKTGQISTRDVEHPQLKKLVDAGEVEILDDGPQSTDRAAGGRKGRPSFLGHGSSSGSRRSGDR
jgi:hypothetical protein